jgi:hypothetical protein
MQKALEQMNLKLAVVVTDITGLTGWQIIQAILKGVRDPAKLAQLRHPRCKASEQQIAQALTGSYRQEHLFDPNYRLARLPKRIPASARSLRADHQSQASPEASARINHAPGRRRRKVRPSSHLPLTFPGLSYCFQTAHVQSQAPDRGWSASVLIPQYSPSFT